MNRNEFIGSLIAGLGAAPENEKAEIVGYYNELIDDGVESGKSEEEVIASFGEPGEIVRGTAELFQRKKAGAAWARGLTDRLADPVLAGDFSAVHLRFCSAHIAV